MTWLLPPGQQVSESSEPPKVSAAPPLPPPTSPPSEPRPGASRMEQDNSVEGILGRSLGVQQTLDALREAGYRIVLHPFDPQFAAAARLRRWLTVNDAAGTNDVLDEYGDTELRRSDIAAVLDALPDGTARG